MARTQLRNDGGFSLLELLIAAAITTIVCGVARRFHAVLLAVAHSGTLPSELNGPVHFSPERAFRLRLTESATSVGGRAFSLGSRT